MKTRVGVVGSALVLAMSLLAWVSSATPASAEAASPASSYVPISGAGSTFSQNAIAQWIADVHQYGMMVNYTGTGSADGRRQFINGTVDFAASEAPFQPFDGTPTPGSYALTPVTAGGVGLVYNLNVDGRPVTGLRLSGENVAKIFAGVITNWDDPALAADNPGVLLPDRVIVPVVRSDEAGTTQTLTAWMADQYPQIWSVYCQKSGQPAGCGPSPYYAPMAGTIAQAGDLGVAGYVAQSYAQGAIGYVNYAAALKADLPLAKVSNASGYYTSPLPGNVALSLLAAQVDTTDTSPSQYLTEELHNVFADPDPRAYPLSYYSYLIVPTTVQGSFTAVKGQALASFTYYALCQGQQEAAALGYAPLPVNLVKAGFAQLAKIPGAAGPVNLGSCNNPTFDKAGNDLLTKQVPLPLPCDRTGPVQCVPGGLLPLTPARILDTRTGVGLPGPLQGGRVVSLPVLGHGGVPASGVAAVVLNVTVTRANTAGYLTVYPGLAARPPTSNLNFSAGQTVANLVITPVGVDGDVDFYIPAGTAQVIADVSGWFASGSPAGGGLTPLTPARILDTRVRLGGSGPAQAGKPLSLPVLGQGGLPGSGVAAVVLNVTVTQPTAPGYLTVYPDGLSRPVTSNLNFSAGQTVPNLVIVPVGADGNVDFYIPAGSAQITADVSGWFGPGSAAGGGLTPLTPARILDTRIRLGATGPAQAGKPLSLAVLGQGGLPTSGVAAVVLNVTVTQPTAAGYLTVYPDGVSRPPTSNLNFSAGQTVPNLVIAPVGADGNIDFYNPAGSAQVVADVSGWITTG